MQIIKDTSGRNFNIYTIFFFLAKNIITENKNVYDDLKTGKKLFITEILSISICIKNICFGQNVFQLKKKNCLNPIREKIMVIKKCVNIL